MNDKRALMPPSSARTRSDIVRRVPLESRGMDEADEEVHDVPTGANVDDKDVEKGNDTCTTCAPAARSRSKVLLHRLSKGVGFDDDDDDVLVDPVQLLASSSISKRTMKDEMKNWRAEWRGQLRKLAMLTIPVAVSVLAGAIAKAAYPGKVAGQLAVWAWCAIPGLILLNYCVCDTAEFALLTAVDFVLQGGTWWSRIVVRSMHYNISLVLLYSIQSQVLFPLALALGSSGAGTPDVLGAINTVTFVVMLVSWLALARAILYSSVRWRAVYQVFNHAMEDLTFSEEIFDRLMNIMDRAERIMDEDLHFPIRMLDDRWVRSDDHQLTIRSERDMALFGIIVFDNFISGSDSDSTVITFEQWADLLADQTDAKRSFRLFFDNQCWKHQAVDVSQFATGAVRYFRARRHIGERIVKFQSTAKFMQSVADIPFAVIGILLLVWVSGFSVTNFALSISAIIISGTFAFGSLIQQLVQSIVFIFYSKPYEVNDLVIIGDVTYRVRSFSFSQTKLEQSNGKVTVFPHEVLLQERITNLSASSNATTTMDFETGLNTPDEAIERLRRSLEKRVAKDSVHWRKMSLRTEVTPNCQMLSIRIKVQSALPWRNLEAFEEVESDLKSFIRRKLIRLKMV
ncbi:hypothetical protein PBRA_000824 [Plasmodiophora brassicae]|uniref:Mechanosensitive ion channel MscS domain-containing protein n=1 Tax=Plasmodiophora brassicae TaxID=37360 RepID=A0A0G4IQI1_PLABS|nr:hypothetical protein PBRA_000824 [Plasmodiophora brassicae]